LYESQIGDSVQLIIHCRRRSTWIVLDTLLTIFCPRRLAQYQPASKLVKASVIVRVRNNDTRKKHTVRRFAASPAFQIIQARIWQFRLSSKWYWTWSFTYLL